MHVPLLIIKNQCIFQNGVLVSGLSVTPTLILNYFMNVLVCPIFTNCSWPLTRNLQTFVSTAYLSTHFVSTAGSVMMVTASYKAHSDHLRWWKTCCKVCTVCTQINSFRARCTVFDPVCTQINSFRARCCTVCTQSLHSLHPNKSFRARCCTVCTQSLHSLHRDPKMK